MSSTDIGNSATKRRVLGLMLAAGLFSAAIVSFTAIVSPASAYTPFVFPEGKTDASINANAMANNNSSSSDHGKNGNSTNANGSKSSESNAEAGANAAASYKQSYPKEKADEKKPFTVHSENHLYKPGEEVKVEGSISSSLIDQIGGDVGIVKLNVTDNKGNVTGQEDATVNDDGEFSMTLTLPENAEQGAYTINATISVDANLVDTLKANLKSKLETSAKFVVVSPNAFAVKAEGKDFTVDIASNSTVKNFEFKQQEKKVSFHVEGQNGTRGVTQITIPKAMLSGEIMVSVDGKVIPPESSDVVTIADTEEGETLEINYHHSEHTIEVSGTNVVPEFPLPVIGVIAAIIGVVPVNGRTRLLRPRQ